MTEVQPSYRKEELKLVKREKVQHVTLNRPSSLNAINLSMVRDLTNHLKQWVKDPGTSAITIQGEGEKAFCSGGDLKAITFSAREGGNYGQQFFYEEFTLNYIVGIYPKPLIALLNGITFGGAAGLTVIGRFCVATERTTFCMPECAIGLFPDVGSGYFLSNLPGKMGFFLALTGHKLSGFDLVKVGLASHYMDYTKIPLFESALENLPSPVSVDDVEELLNKFQILSQTDRPGSYSLDLCKEKVAHCFSGDSVEEIVKNLQQDGSEWAITQLGILKKMSPTSLKITLRLLKESMNKSLAETLQTEYRLTQRCMEDHDFHEGIRATILDKDKNPQWVPSTLGDVSDERIDYYFSAFPNPEKELVLTDVFS